MKINMLQSFISFFNHPFFVVIGGVSTVLMLLGFLYTIWLILRGVLPVWYRLGMGLSKRRVAIFASDEAYNGLKSALIDSGIFNQGNISQIRRDNTDKAKDYTIFLVDWSSVQEDFEKVFSARNNHQTAVIIYCPSGVIIPQDIMSDIANRANTAVVNFRGRLLNDILTSLITTSYER